MYFFIIVDDNSIINEMFLFLIYFKFIIIYFNNLNFMLINK